MNRREFVAAASLVQLSAALGMPIYGSTARSAKVAACYGGVAPLFMGR